MKTLLLIAATALTSTCLAQDTISNECDAYFSYVTSSEGNVSFTNLSNPSDGYFNWIFGDGNYASSFNAENQYESDGSYNTCLMVEAYDSITQQGCFDEYCEIIQIVGAIDSTNNGGNGEDTTSTGIKMIDLTSFKIYQNSNGQIESMLNSSELSQLSFELIDLNGRRLLSQKFETRLGSNKITMNHKELSTGVYFITISKMDQSISKKIWIK
jgi:hypothetical protein